MRLVVLGTAGYVSMCGSYSRCEGKMNTGEEGERGKHSAACLLVVFSFVVFHIWDIPT